MIHIVEGRIGSGKTYWCVAYILEFFFYWDKRFFNWFHKKDVPKIITNIRGINIGSVIDLDELLDSAGSLENLFYIDPVTYKLRYEIFQNAVIMIDEAQSPRWFPRMYKSATVMLFFQLHRHFGAEVFLATQDVKTLCPDLRELPEYHLRCVRQSLQLGGYFTYRKYYDEEAGATTRIKRDKAVFDAYKSAEKGIEHKRVPSALMRYVYIMVVCVALFILGGYVTKNYFFSGKKPKSSVSAPVKKNSLVVVERHVPVEYSIPQNSSVVVPPVVSSLPPSSKVVPSLNLDEVRQCDKVGSVETDRFVEMFQCGNTVFSLAADQVVNVHKVWTNDRRIEGREHRPDG